MMRELETLELEGINGGNPVVVAIAAGAIAYFAGDAINESVKKSTGKDVPEHIVNAAGKAMEAAGSGLKSVGHFITGH